MLDDDGTELNVIVPPDLVLPNLAREDIARLATRTGADAADLERRLKERALLTVSQPAKARLQLAADFAAYIAETCFPIREGAFTVSIDPQPARFAPPRFDVRRDLNDPSIALDREDVSRRAGSILDGLSRYGSYDKPGGAVRLAVLAPPEHIVAMRSLVDRINRGRDRYQGAPTTFGVHFDIALEMAGDQQTGYDAAIRELVRRPDADDLDVVLAYLPKGDNVTDPRHPYFMAKKLLLADGFPSQMVDTATLVNPRWKDLNLALNLFAKAGHIPWVLDEGLDDVDLFIGLSYSTSPTGGSNARMMAYVNVFDRYGRWRLYESDAVAFPFADRLEHLGTVVANSLAAYRAKAPGEPLRTIHIHYSKKFGRDEMRIITEAIQRAVPGAQIAFVSINMSHPLRLFDLREDREGVIDRAAYLNVGPKRLYLATTGSNPLGSKGMGTPIPLELTVWTEPFEYRPSLQLIAQTVLALTRLNWSSTRPFAHEPISTKYAGKIAYGLGVFLGDPTFKLNPRLRDRPWFL